MNDPNLKRFDAAYHLIAKKPFPYFGHGIGGLNVIYMLSCWFQREPLDRDRDTIVELFKTGVDIFRLAFYAWFDNHLHIFIDDIVFKKSLVEVNDMNDPALFENYAVNRSGLPAKNIAVLTLTRDVDNVLAAVHEAYPVALACNYQNRAEWTQWHKASLENPIPTITLFKDYFENHRPRKEGNIMEGRPAEHAYIMCQLEAPPYLLVGIVSHLVKKPVLSRLSAQDKDLIHATLLSAFGYDHDADTELFQLLLKLRMKTKAEVLDALPAQFKQYREQKG